MKKKVATRYTGDWKSIKNSHLIIVATIAALVILPTIGSAWVYDIRQNFPEHLQGENGIFLQYRTSSNYTDLINENPFGEPKPVNPLDYVFVNPDLTDQDHYPVILGYAYNDPVPSLNQISAAPSCTPRNNIDADAVMRITIPDNGGQVQITGSCASDTASTVYFTIYKGAGNYNSPVWSAWNSGVINVTIPYSKGEQLFFATNAGSDGCPDLSYWKDLKLKLNVTKPSTHIGVFRPTTGSWYFDITNTGSVAKTYFFGKSGDEPVPGDWNGDGFREIGIIRNNNLWLLDASGNGAYGSGDFVYTFGKTGDNHIIGDWNNDGKDEIGVIRNNSTWILDASGNGAFGPGDFYFTFGKSGDVPFIGNWNLLI